MCPINDGIEDKGHFLLLPTSFMWKQKFALESQQNDLKFNY